MAQNYLALQIYLRRLKIYQCAVGNNTAQ